MRGAEGGGGGGSVCASCSCVVTNTRVTKTPKVRASFIYRRVAMEFTVRLNRL